MRALTFFVVAVALAVTACGDSGGEEARPAGGFRTPTPEVPVGTTAEGPPQASDDLRQEIADTLKGFTEAFLNGELLKLATYWSEECSQEDIDAIGGAVVLAAGFVGGEAELLVDSDKLIVEELGDGRVRVPGDADQPQGTYEILIDGRPLPNDDAEEEDDAIVLAFESGVWRVTNCDELAADIEF